MSDKRTHPHKHTGNSRLGNPDSLLSPLMFTNLSHIVSFRTFTGNNHLSTHFNLISI